MRYLIIELFGKMYHGKLHGHQHGGRKPAKTSGVYLGYFKAFLLSAELSHIHIDAFYYMLADQTQKKNTRQVDVFMYVTCLQQQSFCHALRKNLKFKLLYFQNKECYPAETSKPMEIYIFFYVIKIKTQNCV